MSSLEEFPSGEFFTLVGFSRADLVQYWGLGERLVEDLLISCYIRGERIQFAAESRVLYGTSGLDGKMRLFVGYGNNKPVGS
jgi:hypothetical protein